MNSKFYAERRNGCVFSFICLNLSMVAIDSLKLIFACDVFVGVSDRSNDMCFFFHQPFTKPLATASMIAF